MAIGPVTITTFNPVTITGLEYSTNLYLVARNDGDTTVTLRSLEDFRGPSALPEWIYHLYAFQGETVTLEPGAETTFEFMVTNEGDGEAELAFRFRVEETGEDGTVPITLRSPEKTCSPACVVDKLPGTSLITGTVTDPSGDPIRDVEVELRYYSGRLSIQTRTDSRGGYTFLAPSLDDILAYLGPRPLPYDSLSYFLMIEHDGYAFLYRGDIAPVRGETMSIDLVLQPQSGPTIAYQEVGKLATDGAYGYSWLLPNKDFTSLAAVQSRHPPELNVPGHFLQTDLSGKELWRVNTGDECWGFDVATDGRVAAGCHDGKVYLANAQGNLIWEKNISNTNLNREVEFSPDGASLFTGPYQDADAVLLDSATGEPRWTYSKPNEWLRNSRFSRDGQRLVAGFSGGLLVMFTHSGNVLWERQIGQFPTFLAIDDAYNVYAAGKNRELFSFAADGELRWRRRIPNHVVTAGDMSEDGTLIVLGTVGNWIYAFNQDGEILWQRGGIMGGNSIDMTPDGSWIVDGSPTLYDRNGTTVWSPEQDGPGAIFETVAISDDGRHIATGDGGSVIRILERD